MGELITTSICQEVKGKIMAQPMHRAPYLLFDGYGYQLTAVDVTRTSYDSLIKINANATANKIVPFESYMYGIKKVIFNDPATIVFWNDGSKTVVKKQPEDEGKPFDKEKGLAMAIAKKALGNKGRYFNTIRKWVELDDEQ